MAYSIEKLAIVIPTLNEAGNINTLLPHLLEDLHITSIIVVDDHSTDSTIQEVKKIQTQTPRLHLIERTRTKSFAQSYKEGFDYALNLGAGAIIQMDADGSHAPQDIAKIYDALKEYDVVVGSRYIKEGRIEGWNFRRKMISQLGNLYARNILGIPVRDLTGGFNGWRREVLEKILQEEITFDGYFFQIWLKWQARKNNYSIIEVPITFQDRTIGTSKFKSSIIKEGLVNVFKMKFATKTEK